MTMTEQSSLLCQSGEKATVAGVYEIVGVRAECSNAAEITREFQVGEMFPDYQGRAVSWILVRRIESVAPTEKRATGELFAMPWQNHQDQS
jgi:hypothetical protein